MLGCVRKNERKTKKSAVSKKHIDRYVPVILLSLSKFMLTIIEYLTEKTMGYWIAGTSRMLNKKKRSLRMKKR